MDSSKIDDTRVARAKRGTTSSLPDKAGKPPKRVATALPGKHTRQQYDQCVGKEATVLAQLRTGVARLSSYLMLQCTETHRSNISFYLGGKSPSDDKNWTPNMKAVRATIHTRQGNSQ
ncbi:hypothetical protein GQ53DRAFT_794671 [Thozetella sp. PMI_491]|nr:hypothetical protein GQ53DRAFT_794671 [Thozetella sp. PMI_491]